MFTVNNCIKLFFIILLEFLKYETSNISTLLTSADINKFSGNPRDTNAICDNTNGSFMCIFKRIR